MLRISFVAALFLAALAGPTRADEPEPAATPIRSRPTSTAPT
jgi:hypothetical protein